MVAEPDAPGFGGAAARGGALMARGLGRFLKLEQRQKAAEGPPHQIATAARFRAEPSGAARTGRGGGAAADAGSQRLLGEAIAREVAERERARLSWWVSDTAGGSTPAGMRLLAMLPTPSRAGHRGRRCPRCLRRRDAGGIERHPSCGAARSGAPGVDAAAPSLRSQPAPPPPLVRRDTGRPLGAIRTGGARNRSPDSRRSLAARL